MSKVHNYIVIRGTTYSIVCCFKVFVLKINYLCLDKGTEGKHKNQYIKNSVLYLIIFCTVICS